MRKFLKRKVMLFMIIISLIILNIYGFFKVEKNQYLIGKSQNHVFSLHGEPMYSDTFTLTDNPYEYRYGLLSVFPDPNDKNILILESGWVFWYRKRMVIWFYKKNDQWEVVDNITWPYDIINF